MRLIDKLLRRHKRASAWDVAWEDSPKYDVQRNRFTRETRWRRSGAKNAVGDLYPWAPGLPPVQTAMQELESLVHDIIKDAPAKPVGPIRTYGRATSSGIKEGVQAMSDGSRETVMVYVQPGRNHLQEAMRRASENMRMEVGVTEVDSEAPARRPPRVVILRQTESFYSVEMEFPTGVVVEKNLTMLEIGRIIKRMTVTL